MIKIFWLICLAYLGLIRSDMAIGLPKCEQLFTNVKWIDTKLDLTQKEIYEAWNEFLDIHNSTQLEPKWTVADLKAMIYDEYNFVIPIAARIDGKTVGFMIHSWPLDQPPGFDHIIHWRYIAVTSEFRGTGLAYQMASHLIKRAKIAGGDYIKMIVGRNNFAARKFLSSLGFINAGPEYMGHENVNEIVQESGLVYILKISDTLPHPVERGVIRPGEIKRLTEEEMNELVDRLLFEGE